MALKKYEEEDIRSIANIIRLNLNYNDTYTLKEISNIIYEYIEDYQHKFRYLIGYRSFLALTSLPDGITSIGNYTFYDCTNLALTSLPDGITSIDKYAFNNCKKLKLTSLPNGLTNIGDYAFNNCTSLQTLTFKCKPSKIYSTAFTGCKYLKTLNVPWSKGEVTGAPWGATNATINYNYIEE